MTSTGRAKDIDLIKTLAILCVVFIHVGGVYYAYEVGSFEWNTALFYGSAVRAGVPLFLMCSGALLLEPDKLFTVKRLYTHTVPRILAAMLFWGTLYKLWHLAAAHMLSVATVINAVKELLVFNQEFHFYYLHIILLVYVLLPISRHFVATSSKQLLEYALVFWLLTGIVYPTISGFWPFRLLSGMVPQYMLNMTYASVGYTVLGYYLRKYPLKTAVYAVSVPVGFAIIFGGTYALSVKARILNELLFSGMSFGVCILAVGIYGLCVKKAPRLGKMASCVTLFVSKGSFCVYLVHMLVLYVLQVFGINAYMGAPLYTVPLLSFAVLFLGLLVYAGISKIPVLNKWIV